MYEGVVRVFLAFILLVESRRFRHEVNNTGVDVQVHVPAEPGCRK